MYSVLLVQQAGRMAGRCNRRSCAECGVYTCAADLDVRNEKTSSALSAAAHLWTMLSIC